MRETFPHSPSSFPRRRESAPPTITRPSRTHPRHSCTPPRHSRTLSTSFPRRRESPCPCEATAFRFLPQSPRAAGASDKPAADGNRHNATGYNRAQRKLVPARARTRARCSQHGGRRWVVQRPRERRPSSSFPHPVYVIPAKAGICAPARGNGIPLPSPIAARSKSRHQTPRRRKSTQCDRIQQSTTKTRARACAHTREATAFRFLPQSPPAARSDTKPAVDGNRHNATEFYEPQRKLVPAREASPCCASPAQRVRPALKPVIPILNPVRPALKPVIRALKPVIRALNLVIPAPTHVIPAKAGIPVPAPAAKRTHRPDLPPSSVRHRPTNRTHEESRLRFGTARDTLIDGVRCRAPRRLANECRTAHPRTIRPCT